MPLTNDKGKEFRFEQPGLNIWRSSFDNWIVMKASECDVEVRDCGYVYQYDIMDADTSFTDYDKKYRFEVRFMGYCEWANINERNKVYHDEEWGRPVHDDIHMFEHLTLECLQCGLSWDLMLKKREVFRSCFDGFDFEKIAEYNEEDIERIMNTENMIRSPRKIAAVISNAKCVMKLREEFGSFCDYIWSFSGGKTILYNGHNKENGKIPVSNGLSKRISRDLKKRGFKYVGEITIYSHLQACGIINDHDDSCPCFKMINENCPTIKKRRDEEVF